MARPKLDAINQPEPPFRPPKAPRVLAPLPEPEPVAAAEDDALDQENVWQRAPLWLRATGTTIVVAALLAGSFELVYAGKVFPGVTADGAYLGGLSQKDALAHLKIKTGQFNGGVITISNGDTNLRIPVARLGVTYDPAKSAAAAYNYGRRGTVWDRLREQGRALLGRATTYTSASYDAAKVTPYLIQLDDDLVQPVQNATLNFNDNQAQVTPAQSGRRLDLGHLDQLVAARIEQTSSEPITAPVYDLTPDIDTAPLQAATSQLNQYLAGPITVNYNGTSREIDQQTIISWIQVGAKPAGRFTQTLKLEDLFPPAPSAKLTLDQSALKAYVADLASHIDQTPQNAALAMQDGQLSIVQASRNGIKVDQSQAVDAIGDALDKPGGDRSIDLKLDTATAAVNENNLDQLGIKEQISEGQTFFPGSTQARLTNVRSGAKKFNGVLLAPDEVFSFGKLLGDVGPETGYVPELVILADHEEKQYGGGLCQVSSTAFRAALAAGLPILERHNHSFAISYYTAPYGVPGVDATIYYPQLDFKFKNDTGHYILMQTTMQGTSLKFDFFGTKTKSGTVRGPEFISGTNDATKPSHTVFYRDVLDLAGNVTKTDKFDTYYKPSTDFPVTQQYN